MRRSESSGASGYSRSRHRLPDVDYRSTNQAYHLTICAASGEPFGDPRLAVEVIDSLHSLRTNRGLLVYAYCLMPDHLHLLVQPQDGRYDIGHLIGAMKTFTTRQSRELGYRGPLWQPRFYDRVLRRSADGEKIAAYILANPVRKRLVQNAGDYKWSGAPDPL